MDNAQAREDELMALESIYTSEEITLKDNEGSLIIHLELPKKLSITGDLTKIPFGFKHFVNKTEEGSETYPLKYLPPVSLNFFLPAEYPSDAPPVYTINCTWMQDSLKEKLCKLLDDEWKDVNDVVLFTWVGIVTDSWSLLELPEHFQMPSSTAMVAEICQYDRERRQVIYNQAMHDCNVCFEEVIGRDCFCFSPCDHTYCNNCMTSYFSVLIKAGDVNNLGCPYDNCESEAIPVQVKVLVTPAEFEKYERLLLQRSIDQMEDVVRCPRSFCDTVNIRESDTLMVICSSCSLAFCILCDRTWHGVAPCELKSGKHKELLEEWEAADEGGREALMKRYGRNRVKNIVSEHQSSQYLDENATACPNCKTSIQKTDGCNKMHCPACHKSFCWLCNSLISEKDPYAHFRPGGDCANKLFEGTAHEDGDEDIVFEDDPNPNGNWIQLDVDRVLDDNGDLDVIALAEAVFGHEILFDENGNPILWDEDGNQIAMDNHHQ